MSLEDHYIKVRIEQYQQTMLSSCVGSELFDGNLPLKPLSMDGYPCLKTPTDSSAV